MSKVNLKTKSTKWIPKKTHKEFKLDLACGNRKHAAHDDTADWIGVDIFPTESADYVWDLTKYPWPIDDEIVDDLFSSHFFEHLDGPERIAFMEESWRILKPTKQLTIICPYWSSMRSVQDPYHKWPPVCETSFLYFNKEWREKNKLGHYPIVCDWDFGYGFILDPEVGVRNQEYQMFASKHYVNSAMDIKLVLTKRGGKNENNLSSV